MTSHLTIQQSVELALQRFASGKLQEAQALCQQVLKDEPANAEALHLMGVLELRAERFHIASDLIGRAIAANPAHPGYYCNLGQALAAQGNVEPAITAYRRALSINPNMLEAHNNLANVLRSRGEYAQAISEYTSVLRARPNVAQVWHNLALALQDAGRLDEAVDAFGKALALDGSFGQAAESLASLLHRIGRLDQAIATYMHLLRLCPDHPDALNGLANAFQDSGQMELAVSTYQKALAIRNNYPEAHNNLGNALWKIGRFDDSIASFKRAIELRPGYAEAHRGMGNVYRMAGRHEEAIAAHREAIRILPECVTSWCDLGSAHMARNDVAAAIESYRRALVFKPDHPPSNLNLGMAHLLRGDYEQGLPLYEYRRHLNGLAHFQDDFKQPIWDGGDLNGRRILIHAEQGLGDTIQFVRYLPMVAERGGRIVLACHAELRRLLERMDCIDSLSTHGEVARDFQVHCPLPSLAMKFKTTLKTIPASTPYLHADPESSARWRGRMGGGDGRLKIGLVWAGKLRPDPKRMMPLGALAPLAEWDNAKFFSLQVGDAAAQLRNPPQGLNIEDCSPDLKDIAETAALIENLDLLITIDTMAAHLAGAMGKAVWVLLPFIPDWRWLLDRNDSPWYPTMKLFRQARADDWSAPVKHVVESLASISPG